MMMKNNKFTWLIESTTDFFFVLFMLLIHLVGIISRISLFILSAFFDLSLYIASFFTKIDKDYDANKFLDQVEDFIFPFFVGYYRLFTTTFRVLLFFSAFIIPYFFFLNIELSNESLLFGCLVFTIFLLYNSVKDFLISSISTDIQNMRLLVEKKLDLLARIYLLEKSIIEQQSLTISVLEDCVSKLSSFEANSVEIDAIVFENLLNQIFSDSIFDYYMFELKDEFFKDYFFIEDNFEEGSLKFIDENF